MTNESSEFKKVITGPDEETWYEKALREYVEKANAEAIEYLDRVDRNYRDHIAKYLNESKTTPINTNNEDNLASSGEIKDAQ